MATFDDLKKAVEDKDADQIVSILSELAGWRRIDFMPLNIFEQAIQVTGPLIENSSHLPEEDEKMVLNMFETLWDAGGKLQKGSSSTISILEDNASKFQDQKVLNIYAKIKEFVLEREDIDRLSKCRENPLITTHYKAAPGHGPILTINEDGMLTCRMKCDEYIRERLMYLKSQEDPNNHLKNYENYLWICAPLKSTHSLRAPSKDKTEETSQHVKEIMQPVIAHISEFFNQIPEYINKLPDLDRENITNNLDNIIQVHESLEGAYKRFNDQRKMQQRKYGGGYRDVHAGVIYDEFWVEIAPTFKAKLEEWRDSLQHNISAPLEPLIQNPEQKISALASELLPPEPKRDKDSDTEGKKWAEKVRESVPHPDTLPRR